MIKPEDIYFVGTDLFSEFKTATLEEMYDYCIGQREVSVDIETTKKYKDALSAETIYKGGLSPQLSKIVMIQIGTLEKKFVIDARRFSLEILKKYLLPILEDKDIVKVGQNLMFEGGMFLEHIKCRIINVWDTFAIEKVLYNGFRQSNSLEALISRYLNIQPVKSLNLFNEVKDFKDFDNKVEKVLEKSFLLGNSISEEEAIGQVEEDLLKNNFVDKAIRLEFLKIGDKPFTTAQIEYGAKDIEYPLRIKALQEKGRVVNGKIWCPTKAFRIENKLTQVLAEMSWRGVPFDQIQWLEVYDKNKKLFIKRKSQLDNHIINTYPDFTGSIDMFTKEPTCRIKWSSSKEVIKLFKKLGLAKKEKSKSTGKMEWTVGAKTLFRNLPNHLKTNFYKNKDVEITDIDSLCLQYLLYKKSEQLTTTFGKDWLKYVHPITKKVHCNFNQYLISGRLAASKPNLQQLPSTKDFRSCFIAGKGYKWISSDYSGQELKIAAELHNVDSMIEFFVKGDTEWGSDFHSFSASQMQTAIQGKTVFVPPKEINGEKNPNFTKENDEWRSISKNTSFKILYGGGAYTLSLEFGISLEKGEDYVEGFFKGLPGMEESFTKKKNTALKEGWVQCSNFSDKRYFYPDMNEIQKLKEKAWNLAPEDYRNLTREEKDKVLVKLRAETEWSSLWKEFNILKGKLERRSLNLPCQGQASEMMKLALLYMYDARWNNGLEEEFIPLIPVHDESNAISLVDKELEGKKIQEESMISGGKLTCKKINMSVSTNTGDCWIH